MSDERWHGAVRKTTVTLLVLGCAIVAAYFVLAATTSIGDPADIGGGVILLVGYVVTGVGLAFLAADLMGHRRRSR